MIKFEDLIYGFNHEEGGANTMIVYLAGAYAKPDKIYHTNLAGLEREANPDGDFYYEFYNENDEPDGRYYLNGEVQLGDFDDSYKASVFFDRIKSRNNYQIAYLLESQEDLDRLKENNIKIYNKVLEHFL